LSHCCTAAAFEATMSNEHKAKLRSLLVRWP